jgi:hypothetical protein
MSQRNQLVAQCTLDHAQGASREAIQMIQTACSDLQRNRRNEKHRRYSLCLLNHLGGAQGRGAANQIASAAEAQTLFFDHEQAGRIRLDID